MKRDFSPSPNPLPAQTPTGLGAGRRFSALARALRDRVLRRGLPPSAGHVFTPVGHAVHDGEAVDFTSQRKPRHERDAA